MEAQRHIGGYPTDDWLIRRDLSGDIIVEQAVHEMNIFCWLLRAHPLPAAGLGGRNEVREPPQRTILDHYVVSYGFPNDLTVRYSHCIYTPALVGCPPFRVFGSKKRAGAHAGTPASTRAPNRRDGAAPHVSGRE